MILRQRPAACAKVGLAYRCIDGNRVSTRIRNPVNAVDSHWQIGHINGITSHVRNPDLSIVICQYEPVRRIVRCGCNQQRTTTSGIRTDIKFECTKLCLQHPSVQIARTMNRKRIVGPVETAGGRLIGCKINYVSLLNQQRPRIGKTIDCIGTLRN